LFLHATLNSSLYEAQMIRREIGGAQSATRYGLTASVLFSWAGQEPHWLQGEGVAHDVSTAGAFLLTSLTGSRIKMQILLPSFLLADQSLKLVAEGRVVRVEHPAHDVESSGFAIVSEGFAIPKTRSASKCLGSLAS
jgi:hypothetical protein